MAGRGHVVGHRFGPRVLKDRLVPALRGRSQSQPIRLPHTHPCLTIGRIPRQPRRGRPATERDSRGRTRPASVPIQATLPLDVITDRLASVYRGAGYDVQVIETAPTMARFEVHDGDQRCEVDLLKAGIQPPVRLGIGPVLALDDAVGLKVGALRDRGTHRDFIDVHAAHTRGGYSLPELERLGAAHLFGSRLANYSTGSTRLSSWTTRPSPAAAAWLGSRSSRTPVTAP